MTGSVKGFLAVAGLILGAGVITWIAHERHRRDEAAIATETGIGSAPGLAPASSGSHTPADRFDPNDDTEIVFEIGGIRLPASEAYAASARPLPATPRVRESASSPRKKGELSAGHPQGTPSSLATYTVGDGETLSVIAKRLLGSAARWREIAELNGIGDPTHLRAGQKIRIP